MSNICIPKFPLWILKIVTRNKSNDSVMGDLEELYEDKRVAYNRFIALFWLWRQVLRSIPIYLYHSLQWRCIMFINYLKITFRNIRKNKTYTVINILGLAVGMVCTVLIMLWVRDEISMNRYHKNIDHIYRMTEWSRGENSYGTVTALAPAMKDSYPEIINYARYVNGDARFLVKYKDKAVFENIKIGDFSLFEIFSFSLVAGSVDAGKHDSRVMLISRKKAMQFFGHDHPVGEIVNLDNQYNMRIVGVYEDIPHQSSIQFDFIVPLEFADTVYNLNYSSDWGNDGNQTFLLLKDNVHPEVFNVKIKSFYQRYDREYRWPVVYSFKDYYLAKWGWNRIENVRIFTSVAFLILIIACINYLNLSTARSMKRAKEVGLRKTVGASRKQIIKQYFSESLILSFIGMCIAVVLLVLTLPVFSTITDKSFSISDILHRDIMLGLVLITIATGIISGLYPALYLSAFNPIKVLRGGGSSMRHKSSFRKVLVVFQFAISICLFVCTASIYKQLIFLRNSDWGFDKENILYFNLEGPLRKNYQGLKSELLENPNVVSVTGTSHTPGGVWYGSSGWDWKGNDPEAHNWTRLFNADPDFLRTFHIDLFEGRFLAANDRYDEAVINEMFMKRFQLKNPVGQYFWNPNINEKRPMKIVGVVHDYHIASFKSVIHPLVILPNFKWGNTWMNFRYLFIKLRPENIPGTLAFIENTVKKHNPDYPFDYQFFNQYFNGIYHAEQTTDRIIRSFAILAVVISCLGLFGLATFSAEQRSREIGIRKTLGASITGIMFLLSRSFIKWVIVANIFALPAAALFINNWFANFAYTTDIGVEFYIIPGLAALVIALVTIIFQVIRAATVNPVEVLKYE